MTGERASTTAATRPGRRTAIAGVVLGALSILVGLVSILGWPVGIAAIVVAGLAVKRGAARRGIAAWGTWLGVAGTVLSMLVLALQVMRR